MTTFNEFLEDKMKDPEFKAEYETLEPEFMTTQDITDTQKSPASK